MVAPKSSVGTQFFSQTIRASKAQAVTFTSIVVIKKCVVAEGSPKDKATSTDVRTF